MLLSDNHFDEYIKESQRIPLHEKINYDGFPENLIDLKNLI